MWTKRKIIFYVLCFVVGCVIGIFSSFGCISPEAVKATAKIGVSEHKSDLKSNIDFKAEQVDQISNTTKQITNYGGTGWVVLVSFLSIILFLLFVMWNSKKYRDMLLLVTTTIKGSSTETQGEIKNRINANSLTGGPLGICVKDNLSKYCKNNGVKI